MSVPPRTKTLTGAGSTWSAQLGGGAGNDMVFDPPLRSVKVNYDGSAGLLSVTFPNGSADVLKLNVDEEVLGEFTSILAVSTVSGVRLGW